jgi:nucleotide-binding universal stress UspA family protein
MEISKIVVGIDFSEESEIAARYAVKIARYTGASVILVHAGLVLDKQHDAAHSAAAREWEQMVEGHLAADRGKLEELRERLAAQHQDVSHMVIDGFADTGLCEAAKELGADLVITGSHGRTGLKRLFMGSVAERVVRLCETSVMVARPGAEGSGPFRRILVPTDFSIHADRALQLAMVLCAPDGQIDVFHAWDTPPELALEWTGPVLHELASQAREAGESLLAKYHREGLTLGFETVRARAVDGVLERLQGGDYDLVVMGSHGRRGLRRLLLGSVAELTVRHAPCSVLVVHHQED